MLLPWLKGVITNILDETANTKRFFIQVQDVEVFDFKPGQFITIDLPIHEQKNKRWRSYSIASVPDGSNTIELVIVKLEGGLGTAWLWEFGKIGAELSFRGPLGHFVLPQSIEDDLFLICTGTGIAPFRSMVNHLYAKNISHKNIYLIFGCRTFSDSLYFTEMRQLQENMPNFHFLPTYSREPADNPYLLRTGYVHIIYEELVLQKRYLSKQGLFSDAKTYPAKFYLCGWKNMVDDARNKILSLGYDKLAIHLELYG